MEIALWILFLAGPIGAIDVVYFHMWKFRLWSRRQSLGEEVTHILRGLVVPLIFAILLLGRPQGTLFWAVTGLFLFDLVNSAIDVMIEPASRAPAGVPPQELAIHFVGITAMGAATAMYLYNGWPARNAPSALAPWPAGTFPDVFPSMAWGGVVIGVLLVTVETALVVRTITLTDRGFARD